jgi:hypothetical protein
VGLGYVALEHYACAAQLHYAFDLFEDALETRAIRGFCVVDPAVDGVAYNAFGVEAAADRVGFHPNSNQIIALKAVQSLFSADSHALILRFLQEKISVW